MLVPVIFIILYTSAYAEDFIVNLPNYGTVNGAKEKSRNEVPYFAFRGILYGKAPIGDLRFKELEKPAYWGAREAKEFGNVCPQVDPFDHEKVTGEEDCLYVNVYTPTLDENANLPVLLWIHGGGFVIGGGGTYGPEYLMDKRLVLVTFNYRLNALGFMHYDDTYLPGNLGMKDQVAVLDWVQEHIHLFGGNRLRVTLAGSSSGAASVNWHMYSPRSEKKFHRAILHSGTARSVWAGIPRHVAQFRASAIATMAGCVFNLKEENVKCLRRISAEEIVRLQTHFEIWKGNPFFFGVVIEAEGSDKAFVKESPWFWSPRVEKMPIMIGFTADEGGFTASGLLKNQGEALQELGQKYHRLFPLLMLYQFNVGLASVEEVLKFTDEVRKHYFKDKEINKETFHEIKNMLADSQVIYDTVVTLKNYKFAKYFYKYSHKNKHTFAELEKPDFLDESGPVHSDDMLSLFNLESIFRDPNMLNDDDLKVSKHMIDLWASFIEDGNPNLDETIEPIWKPAVNDKLKFYDIDIDSEMKEFSWEKSFEFWESLDWQLEAY